MWVVCASRDDLNCASVVCKWTLVGEIVQTVIEYSFAASLFVDPARGLKRDLPCGEHALSLDHEIPVYVAATRMLLDYEARHARFSEEIMHSELDSRHQRA